MPLTLLSQVASDEFKNIRLIATDMDGTLTTAGKFSPQILACFVALQRAGVDVVIVTGRSAGWVSGLGHYLPVAGAIAENGGIFYPADVSLEPAQFPLVPIADLVNHRQQLAQVFACLQKPFPQLQASLDNQFRLTDWTFDLRGLTAAEVLQLGDRCQEMNWGFTYSTVQCHIKLPQQDKATGLTQVLSRYFTGLHPEQVITVGDSPNDESLFDYRQFPRSVGVANVREYCDRLVHCPTYITQAAEGSGFLELCQKVLEAK